MFETKTSNPHRTGITSLLLIFMFKVIAIISDEELSVILGKVEFEEDAEMHLWNDQIFRQLSLLQQLSRIRVGDSVFENLIKKEMKDRFKIEHESLN